MTVKKDSRLIAIIKEDKDLAGRANMKERTKLLSMATLYSENLQENLKKDQFELGDAYVEHNLDFEDWSLFLGRPKIKAYIDGLLNQILRSTTQKNIVEGKASVKEGIEATNMLNMQNSAGNKFNFVVTRLPEKVKWDGEQ